MLQWLKEAYKAAATNGIHLPFAYDAEAGKPSMTLLFPYIAFLMAVGSILAMHFKEGLMLATWTTIIFFVICMVLYRLRKLDKAKFDLDDKSIELSSEKESEEKTVKPISKDE